MLRHDGKVDRRLRRRSPPAPHRGWRSASAHLRREQVEPTHETDLGLLLRKREPRTREMRREGADGPLDVILDPDVARSVFDADLTHDEKLAARKSSRRADRWSAL